MAGRTLIVVSNPFDTVAQVLMCQYVPSMVEVHHATKYSLADLHPLSRVDVEVVVMVPVLAVVRRVFLQSPSWLVSVLLTTFPISTVKVT